MEGDSHEDISVAHLMLNRFNKEVKKMYNPQEYAQIKPLIDGVFIWRYIDFIYFFLLENIFQSSFHNTNFILEREFFLFLSQR